MPLWGTSDANSNSALFAPAQVGLAVNSANRDSLYGNTTADAFVNQAIVGVFGVDRTEAGVAGGPLVSLTIVTPGSGYHANATVTISGGGGANATANAAANSTGRIETLNLTANGTGFTSEPTVEIAAPAAQSFNAASAVTNTFIAITSNRFQVDDLVTYLVAAGNTAIDPLVNATAYYVVSSNSTGVELSETVGGDPIELTDGASETGHSLTGETATAIASFFGGGQRTGALPGWNLRTVGTGGRAGRVHNECLVSVKITSDGSDDSILPDS